MESSQKLAVKLSIHDDDDDDDDNSSACKCTSRRVVYAYCALDLMRGRRRGQ